LIENWFGKAKEKGWNADSRDGIDFTDFSTTGNVVLKWEAAQLLRY
jgi:hypothetical protein